MRNSDSRGVTAASKDVVPDEAAGSEPKATVQPEQGSKGGSTPAAGTRERIVRALGPRDMDRDIAGVTEGTGAS